MKRMWTVGMLLAAIALSLNAAMSLAQEHATPAPTGAHDETIVESSGGEIGNAPAGAHAGAAHHEEAPQLIRGPEAGLVTAITTLIIFALLLAVLGKYAWGPIAGGLKQREDKIRKDISDAEAARARAEQTLKEYSARLAAAENEVREMISKATADAERVAAGVRERAQVEADATKDRAIKDIDAAGKQAMAEVYEQTATLATGVAEKILRRNLNADDQRDLVNQSLEQLQTIKN